MKRFFGLVLVAIALIWLRAAINMDTPEGSSSYQIGYVTGTLAIPAIVFIIGLRLVFILPEARE